MAKKGTTTSKSTRTPVRRTSTPRARTAASADAAAPANRVVTDADIAKRAYELFCSGAPGGQLDHWLQAERELRGV
jgi:hypothetical protein